MCHKQVQSKHFILILEMIIKTHGSEGCEAKKKQHACASSGLRDHYSELLTRMAALKFENAITLPL